MKIYLLLASVLAVIMGGCASTGMSNAFDKDGIPKQQYWVGGGIAMEHTAREEGTLILADRISKTMISTKSMKTGEKYNTVVDRSNQDGIKILQDLGIDPSTMKLSLYFIPAGKAENDDTKIKPDNYGLEDID